MVRKLRPLAAIFTFYRDDSGHMRPLYFAAVILAQFIDGRIRVGVAQG